MTSAAASDARLQRIRECRDEVIAPAAIPLDREGGFPSAAFEALDALEMPSPCPDDLHPGVQIGDGRDDGLIFEAIYEIAQACPSTALCFAHHAFVATALCTLATPDLRAAVRGGRGRPIFATTGAGSPRPIAGRSVAEPGMPATRAEFRDGHIVLSGRPRYVPAAGAASWYLIRAETSPDDSQRNQAFFVMVPADAHGLDVGAPAEWIGLRGTMTRELAVQDVTVPDHSVLGARGTTAGQSWLESVFHVTHASLLTGIARGVVSFAVEYRRSTTPSLGRRDGRGLASSATDPLLRQRLADLWVGVTAAECLFRAAGAQIAASDPGQPPASESAMQAMGARVYALETAERVAADVFGITGSRSTLRQHDADRYWRDVSAYALYGASDVLRSDLGSRLLEPAQGDR